ncbi:hypothetical protein N864_12560 [Intrasporangium chromatireducens Q5-1]|uniref:Uncharacterized protein n=1 Tax=Intrasporangium chromatireducens Q5-1 TaxID=584657 RepID=W9GT92_9MICO|nr:hypothetical protein [Intrasporangium chromatireducens]EWT07094.1 hypothetical protein N864_12560 [Intrasporangium chromatireducens Q5-1]
MATDIDTSSGSGTDDRTTAQVGDGTLATSLADLRVAIDEVAHTLLVPRLVELVTGRPAERPSTRRFAGVGLLAVAVRLALPVLVTTAAGAWHDAPLWSWCLVAVFFAADQVVTLASGYPHTSRLDDFLALTGRLEREGDVLLLTQLPRRWLRLSVRVAVSAALTLPVLAVGMAVAPEGLTSLHVGSVAMLMLVLYEFSEQVFFGFLITTLFLRRESQYPHRLWWLSPADTPAIPLMLHAWGTVAIVGGVSVVFSMLPVALLVAPGSSTFLIALVGAMTLSGYLVTILSYVSVRASVRTIVRRHQQRTLEQLQHQVDDLGVRVGDLTPAQTGQLRAVMAVYDAVRDAPLTPRSSEAGSHAVTALAVPGIGFFLAVLAEVYAERLLGQLVP